MAEKEADTELAEDIRSGLKADEEKTSKTMFPAYHVGKRLKLGFVTFCDYRLKGHQSIVKQFKKTPRQMRLRPLKLEKRIGRKKQKETIKYALRKGSKTMRVYD